MVDKFKGFRKITLIILSLLGFLALSIFKISWIVGSNFSFFSIGNAVSPLVGIIGMPYVLIVFAIRFFARVMLYKTSYYVALYHLPTLCASYYWASKSRLLAIVVPLVCMMLFMLNPIGIQAAPYVLYWLIPIILGYMNSKSPIASAFISTFIAHAVGSVVWLYMVPMSADAWLALIPVVAVERFCFASLMIFVYYSGATIQQKIKSLKI